MKTKIRLPKEFRKKWLDALESGKYKQTNDSLMDDYGYCCLGVAGRCLNIPKNELGKASMPSGLDKKYISKFPETFFCKSLDGKELYDSVFAEDLADMNDDKRLPFKEIAKYIRSNTRGV